MKKYSPSKQIPLSSYGFLTGIYLLLFSFVIWYVNTNGIRLITQMSVVDLLSISIASYKLAWLLSRDFVTSFIRAPFVKYEQTLGAGSVTESARGEGLQLAIGQLLTCPWCLTQWTAVFFMYGLIFIPDITRFTAIVLVIVAIGEILHLGYERLMLNK